VGVDPRFERAVLAELALSERRVRRHDRSRGPRALARRLHGGRHEAHATSRALIAAGLTAEEVAAVDLLARADHRSPNGSVLHRARKLSDAPGVAGHIARVVARAAIEDLLDGAHPDGDTLAALALLPDPRLMA
jgi:hypothetical protein